MCHSLSFIHLHLSDAGVLLIRLMWRHLGRGTGNVGWSHVVVVGTVLATCCCKSQMNAHSKILQVQYSNNKHAWMLNRYGRFLTMDILVCSSHHANSIHGIHSLQRTCSGRAGGGCVVVRGHAAQAVPAVAAHQGQAAYKTSGDRVSAHSNKVHNSTAEYTSQLHHVS